MTTGAAVELDVRREAPCVALGGNAGLLVGVCSCVEAEFATGAAGKGIGAGITGAVPLKAATGAALAVAVAARGWQS